MSSQQSAISQHWQQWLDLLQQFYQTLSSENLAWDKIETLAGQCHDQQPPAASAEALAQAPPVLLLLMQQSQDYHQRILDRLAHLRRESLQQGQQHQRLQRTLSAYMAKTDSTATPRYIDRRR